MKEIEEQLGIEKISFDELVKRAKNRKIHNFVVFVHNPYTESYNLNQFLTGRERGKI